MKLAAAFPVQRLQPVDGNDIASLSTRLLAQAKDLASMAAAVGQARVIREMHSDRCKRALAFACREFLAQGDSASAAETKGRASISYGEALDKLKAELTVAEETLADYEGKRHLWEATRSALSVLKHAAETY